MRLPGSVVALSLVSVLSAAAIAGCGGAETAREPGTPSSVPAPAAGGGASATGASAGGGDGAAKGEPIKAGDRAPAFHLDNMNGSGKVELAKGKVVVVDFWATWCEPCKKAFPKLQELYVKHKASGLEIAAVSVDEESDVKDIPGFAKAHGARFPVGWGGPFVAGQWKPEKMPTTYIIGKDGVVKHVHYGYHDGEEAEIERELKALL